MQSSAPSSPEAPAPSVSAPTEISKGILDTKRRDLVDAHSLGDNLSDTPSITTTTTTTEAAAPTTQNIAEELAAELFPADLQPIHYLQPEPTVLATKWHEYPHAVAHAIAPPPPYPYPSTAVQWVAPQHLWYGQTVPALHALPTPFTTCTWQVA